MPTLSGDCLCKKVKITANLSDDFFHACHCGICRKWGGGALLTIDAGTQVQLLGEEHVTVFSSSGWAERGFCKHCGTHLFYRLKADRHYFLPLGLLEGTERLVFHSQIFIDKKPSNYSFANDTETLTEKEFFAKFGH